jgi:hypothetical protein
MADYFEAGGAEAFVQAMAQAELALPAPFRHPRWDLEVTRIPREVPRARRTVYDELRTRAGMLSWLGQNHGGDPDEHAAFLAAATALYEEAGRRLLADHPSPFRQPERAHTWTSDSPVATGFAEHLDDEPSSVAFVGTNRVVLGFPRVIRVFDLRGRFLRELPSVDTTLLGVVDEVALVEGFATTSERLDPRALAIEATRRAHEAADLPFDGRGIAERFGGEPDDEAALARRVFSLDLEHGTFALPTIACVRLEEDELTLPHATRLVRDDGSFATVPADTEEDAASAVYTPDLRLAWIGRKVIDTDTAEVLAELDEPDIEEPDIEEPDTDEDAGPARALVRRPDGRLRVLTRDRVHDRVHDARPSPTRFRLPAPALLARFDATGDHLVFVDEDHQVHILGEDGRTLVRFDPRAS